MNSNTLIGISPAEQKTGGYRQQKDEQKYLMGNSTKTGTKSNTLIGISPAEHKTGDYRQDEQ